MEKEYVGGDSQLLRIRCGFGSSDIGSLKLSFLICKIGIEIVKDSK